MTLYQLTWDSTRTPPGAPWKKALETRSLTRALLTYAFMAAARRDVAIRLTRAAVGGDL